MSQDIPYHINHIKISLSLSFQPPPAGSPSLPARPPGLRPAALRLGAGCAAVPGRSWRWQRSTGTAEGRTGCKNKIYTIYEDYTI